MKKITWKLSDAADLALAFFAKKIYIDELMNWDIISQKNIGVQGIMTEAVKQICEYVFDKSDIIRIYAEPFSHNIASCKVPEKVGFQYEGTLRNNAIKNGKVVDMKMYSLLKREANCLSD